MIKNKFLYFKTYDVFDQERSKGNIDDQSIVFIEQNHTIWTHGNMFGDEGKHAKGFFDSIEDLPKTGEQGDWAVVNVDGVWHIYSYNASTNNWEDKGEYEFPNFQKDIDSIYVRYDKIRDFIKNIYDDIYVKKSEVYYPDGWSHAIGQNSDSSSTNPISGGTAIATNVDQSLNKTSLNPIANWVVATEIERIDSSVSSKASQEDVEEAITNLKKDYYTKTETYNRSQIDDKLSKAGLDIRIVDDLPEIGEPRILYMIKPEGEDVYETYVYSQEDGWQQFGSYSFDIDLSQYALQSDLQQLTEQLNSISSYVTQILPQAKQYTDSAVTNVVRWPNVYNPDRSIISDRLVSYTETAGTDPHRSPRITPTIQQDYVTRDEMLQLFSIYQNTGNIDVPKHVFLSQEEYDALPSYQNNTLYFILEPTIDWTFGGTFPVVLAGEGLGTLPITLR